MESNEQIVLISISLEKLETLITDCVNACLDARIERQPVEDRWFTPHELCDYHPDKPKMPTLYAWVHDDKIPYHKGTKRIRFLKSEIDQWLMTQSKTRLTIEDIHNRIKSETDAFIISHNLTSTNGVL